MKTTVGIANRIQLAYDAGPRQFQTHSSALTTFIVVRFYVRANWQRMKELGIKMTRARRTAARLESSPFDRHRLKTIRDYIEAMTALQRTYRDSERQLGRVIIDLAPMFDAATTMEQRLEVLNCNPADRAALTESDVSLVELISVHCVEDSAAHRADEFNIRPLHSAVWAEIIRSMHDTPEGRAVSSKLMDDALAPGGLLYGVRTGHLQPDGTLKLQSPALVLHDASGSRVIERTPT